MNSGKPQYIVAIDEGTTNTKALLVESETGRVLARASRRVGITFPTETHVEQDPSEILNLTFDVIAECFQAAGDGEVIGISISNQRESVVVWDDATGEALAPVLGWQDARTSAFCDELSDRANEIKTRTGLDLDPMFSAPKMRYLLDQVSAEGEAVADLKVGTVDTWLLRRLTGVSRAEMGNASRTLLFNLKTLDWDPDLLGWFGIPASCLAPLAASNANFGKTLPDLMAGSGLLIPEGIPVLSVLADSHSALYFHTGGRQGVAKATYGTGSSVMIASPVSESPHGVASTLAWALQGPTPEPVYGREGNIVATGAALEWVASILTDGSLKEIDALVGTVPMSKVQFVPAFSGLGAPYFDRNAKGILVNITGGTTRADIVNAAFDSIANQIADVVEAIESDGKVKLDTLFADGGITVSGFLMQLQSDLLDRAVHVSNVPEASSLGAALLAARTYRSRDEAATSLTWDEDDAEDRVVSPRMDGASRDERRSIWKSAVARSRVVLDG